MSKTPKPKLFPTVTIIHVIIQTENLKNRVGITLSRSYRIKAHAIRWVNAQNKKAWHKRYFVEELELHD